MLHWGDPGGRARVPNFDDHDGGVLGGGADLAERGGKRDLL